MLLRNMLLFRCIIWIFKETEDQGNVEAVCQEEAEKTTGRGRRACGVPGRQWGGQIQEACGQAREPGKSLWLQSGLALLPCPSH